MKGISSWELLFICLTTSINLVSRVMQLVHISKMHAINDKWRTAVSDIVTVYNPENVDYS